MSADPQVNLQAIEDKINRLFNEVAQLSEMDVAPAEYYGELMKRSLLGLGAPAGAVWIRTPQGHLQLQHQINLRQVGLDQEAIRQSHDELLRRTIQQARHKHLPPHSSEGNGDGGVAAGNPTDFDVLLMPIMVDQGVIGLIEVWQTPGRNPNAVPGYLRFLARMANLAGLYTRNTRLKQITGQQQLWTQLENFARQVHGSLNPTEVAYHAVNEGRRLVECDRVSVAVRLGRKVTIEAISGADVVEKRSNLVQLLRKLCDRVLKWGEKLTYTGTHDDSLPPDVLKALDDYLAESNTKLLVVMPLHDERDKDDDKKKPARSALVMESFDPPASTEQLIARMDVVGRHATSALYNAVEHKRIPMRFIWRPLAKVQEGLGGKARTIGLLVALGLILLGAALVFVSYPLKMEAKGQLLPEKRNFVYSPVEGRIMGIADGIEPGSEVSENKPLLLLMDPDQESRILKMQSSISGLQKEIDSYTTQMNAATEPSDRLSISALRSQKESERDSQVKQLAALRDRTNADETRPGYFWLKAPLDGTILNGSFKEELGNKFVKPSEPLLRIGNKKLDWEIELKIPQKHIGQILYAFELRKAQAGLPKDAEPPDLDVDLLLASAPTHVFKGKLAKHRIAGEAKPNQEDPNDTEPVVLAYVRIAGDDIPKADRLPREQFTTGTEVHTKVRCGNRAMGYSLFYGMWEFFYEKVVFFF